MRALVVGGTGFVGMNVVRALVARGDDVHATRRARGNTLFARRLGARLVVADLDSETELADAMRGREVVFQCAGHYPRYSLNKAREVAIARRRAATALSAARRAGVERFVLVSSMATVGPPRFSHTRSTERDAPDFWSRRTVYHAVKLAIEAETLRAGAGGPDVVVACPGAIFGELDVKAGTGFLIVALANDLLPFRFEGRTNVIDADDLARALIRAAERGRAGQRYLLGGWDLWLSELIDALCVTLRVSPPRVSLPLSAAAALATVSEIRAARAHVPRRPLLSRELVDVIRHGRFLDTSKARQELGLDPPRPLNETLEKACRWYARHGYLKGLPHAEHLARANQERSRPDHPPHSARSVG